MEIKLPGTFTMANILFALKEALTSVSTSTKHWKYKEKIVRIEKHRGGEFATIEAKARLYSHQRTFLLPWKHWTRMPVKLSLAPLDARRAHHTRIDVFIENPGFQYAKFDEIWENFLKLLKDEQINRTWPI